MIWKGSYPQGEFFIFHRGCGKKFVYAMPLIPALIFFDVSPTRVQILLLCKGRRHGESVTLSQREELIFAVISLTLFTVAESFAFSAVSTRRMA